MLSLRRRASSVVWHKKLRNERLPSASFLPSPSFVCRVVIHLLERQDWSLRLYYRASRSLCPHCSVSLSFALPRSRPFAVGHFIIFLFLSRQLSFSDYFALRFVSLFLCVILLFPRHVLYFPSRCCCCWFSSYFSFATYFPSLVVVGLCHLTFPSPLTVFLVSLFLDVILFFPRRVLFPDLFLERVTCYIYVSSFSSCCCWLFFLLFCLSSFDFSFSSSPTVEETDQKAAQKQKKNEYTLHSLRLSVFPHFHDVNAFRMASIRTPLEHSLIMLLDIFFIDFQLSFFQAAAICEVVYISLSLPLSSLQRCNTNKEKHSLLLSQ